MCKYLVKVIKDSTGEVVKNLGPMSEWKADTVYDGLYRQLNHNEFSLTMSPYYPKADYSA